MTPPPGAVKSDSGVILERVTHRFDNKIVVRDLSLVVEAGKLTCLLGPSGCGKTTLLRLSAGLETLQEGRITIGRHLVADGNAHFSLPPEKRGVGLMFQDYALFPHLTILENVTFGLHRPDKARLDWVRDGLARLGLADYADSYPHTLSGGQQQRAALLRAIAPEPGVLLLDEPFSGLDVTRRAQVREETLGLLKEIGVATLMVTHDPEEAMYMGDHIVVMNEGSIVQAGTPAQTYLHPVDKFVAELFGPLNQCSGTVAGGHVTTPLGVFDAPGLGDGDDAIILVRTEGIRPVIPNMPPPPDGVSVITARVVSAHLLGRSSHLFFDVARTNGATIRLQARVPGIFLPEAGAEIPIWADPRQVFVFKA